MGDNILLPEEVAAFDRARIAMAELVRSFESWIAIGEAVAAGDAAVQRMGLESQKARANAFYDLMAERGLDAIVNRKQASMLTKLRTIMEHLPEVRSWRETLTEKERLAWASPVTVWLKCTHFHPAKPPALQVRPTVRDTLAITREENEQLKARIAELEEERQGGASAEAAQPSALEIDPGAYARHQMEARIAELEVKLADIRKKRWRTALDWFKGASPDDRETFLAEIAAGKAGKLSEAEFHEVFIGLSGEEGISANHQRFLDWFAETFEDEVDHWLEKRGTAPPAAPVADQDADTIAAALKRLVVDAVQGAEDADEEGEDGERRLDIAAGVVDRVVTSAGFLLDDLVDRCDSGRAREMPAPPETEEDYSRTEEFYGKAVKSAKQSIVDIARDLTKAKRRLFYRELIEHIAERAGMTATPSTPVMDAATWPARPA
jgi:hypothetical protein